MSIPNAKKILTSIIPGDKVKDGRDGDFKKERNYLKKVGFLEYLLF